MLGQRWQWSSRFGQYITCWDNRGTHGRQLGCTQRWCTHQYRHNNYDHYNYNNYDNVDYYDDGCTDLHDDVDYYDDGCTNHYNYNCGRTSDNNSRTNDNNSRTDYYYVNVYYVNVNVNHASTRCCATAHGQRIRQQFIHLEQRTKTATQQTWCSVTRWRFRVVRGVSRDERP
jgi:hypothetical protein